MTLLLHGALLLGLSTQPNNHHDPFWSYDPSANELEYWIAPAGEAYHTCGCVSAYHGMFMADALYSGGAKDSVSREFNVVDKAEEFVEYQCDARRD